MSQDGHSKECSVISFQCDGSLVLTADWAGVALVWDLRSGQAKIDFLVALYVSLSLSLCVSVCVALCLSLCVSLCVCFTLLFSLV